MKRIILITLLADLLGCFVTGILFLFASPEAAIYATVLTFGNILIPTLAGVLLYQPVKQLIITASETRTLVYRVLVLIAVFAFGLILWSVADVIFSGLSLENVIRDFNAQFRGYVPVALSIAIAIPAIDLLMDDKPGRGKLRFDEANDCFETTLVIRNKPYTLRLPDYAGSAEVQAGKAAGELKIWLENNLDKAKDFAAARLLTLKNEDWLSGYETKLSAEKFAATIEPEGVDACAEGGLTIYFKDHGLFAGHTIVVDVNKAFEFKDAYLAG